MNGVRAAAAVDETFQATAMPRDNLDPPKFSAHVLILSCPLAKHGKQPYAGTNRGSRVTSYRRDPSRIPQKVGRRSDTNFQVVNESHNKEEAFPLSSSFHGSLDHEDELSWADS